MGLELKSIMRGDNSPLTIDDTLVKSLEWLNEQQKLVDSDLFANVLDMKTGNTYKMFSNKSKDKYNLSKNVFPELDFDKIALKSELLTQAVSEAKIPTIKEDDRVFEFNYGKDGDDEFEPLLELTPRDMIGKRKKEDGYYYRTLGNYNSLLSYSEMTQLKKLEYPYGNMFSTNTPRKLPGRKLTLDAMFYKFNKDMENYLKTF